MMHQPRLRLFLGARCRGGPDSAEVDDAMQELWLRCRAVDARGIEDPKAYLFRMANNVAIDRGRQIDRGIHYEADWGYVKDRFQGSAEAATAERSLIARERLLKVNLALQAVGERAAWIFRRHRLEGVAQHEIAVELGVSLSTVEKDIRKAYEALASFRDLPDEE